MILSFGATKMLVDMGRDSLGIPMGMLMLRVRAVVVHDVYGVPVGVGMDVDVGWMMLAVRLAHVA